MVRRGVAAGVACAVVVLAVAGCTGRDDPDMPGLTASPSATRTPTPTPSPTSIAGTVVDLSDPELGIVFEDVPDLSGDEADVYNWVGTYKVEYWRAMRTNTMSPAFAVFASPEAQAEIEGLVAENAADGWVVEGVYRVAISDVAVTGDAATAMVCDDYTDVTVTDNDGPVTLEDAGVATPLLLEVTLARNPVAEGLWMVGNTSLVGSC